VSEETAKTMMRDLFIPYIYQLLKNVAMLPVASVLDFVLVSLKNLSTLEHVENSCESDMPVQKPWNSRDIAEKHINTLD
jgi:hypothetical protein